MIHHKIFFHIFLWKMFYVYFGIQIGFCYFMYAGIFRVWSFVTGLFVHIRVWCYTSPLYLIFLQVLEALQFYLPKSQTYLCHAMDKGCSVGGNVNSRYIGLLVYNSYWLFLDSLWSKSKYNFIFILQVSYESRKCWSSIQLTIQRSN